MKRNLTLALICLLLFALLAGCTRDTAAVELPESTVPLATADAIDTSPTPDPDLLSQQLAMDIALLNAGITADKVEFLEIEFDIENSTPIFEIQFYVNHMEYEYEIHARTGEILYFEQDYS